MALSNSIRTLMDRRSLLAAAVGMVAIPSATAALAVPDPLELAVVDREAGEPLTVWRCQGRLYVAGEPGRRYSLRLTNHSDDRLLAVLSVDGVNILTGETAGYLQRGYIVYPHQSYDILGWRKSLTEVADFTFAPLPQSYAARTGRPGDVGVIGMAVFKEKVVDLRAGSVAGVPFTPPPAEAPPPPPPPMPLPLPPVPHPQAESAGPPQPAPPAPPASRLAAADSLAGPALGRRTSEKLGTAHGDLERSVTYTLPFERATPYPQIVRQIEYDSFDRLVASGIIPRSFGHRPRPFPERPGTPGFVPDPPGER